MDYARLLGNVPDIYEKKKQNTYITVFEKDKSQLVQWHVSQFEYEFKVKWTPYFKCDLYYIEELLFSGFSVGEKDMDFRKKYGTVIEKSSGDENLILAKIDDTVGYGVFAKKHFQEGDFIVRYGGFIAKEEKNTSRAYCMSSGLEGVILDASVYRNLGGVINHSQNPNAEARCIFEKGVEQAIIVATKEIPEGYQIFIDYSLSYFGESKDNFVDLSSTDGFPTYLPNHIF